MKPLGALLGGLEHIIEGLQEAVGLTRAGADKALVLAALAPWVGRTKRTDRKAYPPLAARR